MKRSSYMFVFTEKKSLQPFGYLHSITDDTLNCKYFVINILKYLEQYIFYIYSGIEGWTQL